MKPIFFDYIGVKYNANQIVYMEYEAKSMSYEITFSNNTKVKINKSDDAISLLLDFEEKYK